MKVVALCWLTMVQFDALIEPGKQTVALCPVLGQLRFCCNLRRHRHILSPFPVPSLVLFRGLHALCWERQQYDYVKLPWTANEKPNCVNGWFVCYTDCDYLICTMQKHGAKCWPPSASLGASGSKKSGMSKGCSSPRGSESLSCLSSGSGWMFCWSFSLFSHLLLSWGVFSHSISSVFSSSSFRVGRLPSSALSHGSVRASGTEAGVTSSESASVWTCWRKLWTCEGMREYRACKGRNKPRYCTPHSNHQFYIWHFL